MIEFRLLGAVDLKGSDGETLRSVLAQPKRVALLAYLAVATPSGYHRREGDAWPWHCVQQISAFFGDNVFRYPEKLDEPHCQPWFSPLKLTD